MLIKLTFHSWFSSYTGKTLMLRLLILLNEACVDPIDIHFTLFLLVDQYETNLHLCLLPFGQLF